jgi:amylosucrase
MDERLRLAHHDVGRVRNPEELERRLAAHGPVALSLLDALYDDPDAVTAILTTALAAAARRSPSLGERDRGREANPTWYQSPDLIGAWAYADRFAGTLTGVGERLDYLDELGVTYLHLMPFFARPEGPNDGGYAVSDYRSIHPPLGDMDDLTELAGALHRRGMVLAADFVFNHTSSDHSWALAAKAGSVEDRACYLTFASEEETQSFAPYLREIFPQEKRGSFIFDPDMERWVWSTFHPYQWDLDYRNPEVFRRMLDELLTLANVGIDVIRLDAVPFIWKEPGTPSENLPQVHDVIQAMNALVRIAAPATIFKSEAIVHPDDVRSYLGDGARECEISYNPVLMVELWEALATEHTQLLKYTLRTRFAAPDGTAWVNYLRSHDDIGWGFADEDARAVHIDPIAHRQFLQRFYTGRDPRSFGRGADFQSNPTTGDVRLSGMTASLAGLEQALLAADPAAIDMAIARIRLLHGVMAALPGIPLLRIGDELGTLNDLSYLDDPEHATDSRWLHRPVFEWRRAEQRHDHGTIQGRLFASVSEMLRLRAGFGFLRADAPIEVLDDGPHAIIVDVDGGSLRIVGNFAGFATDVSWGGESWTDALTGAAHGSGATLDPYELLWLVP